MSRKADRIKEVAKLMKNLDFCMFITRSLEGGYSGRPMSNNGEVEFDGDVWFFSGADTRKIREIEADPQVQLSFQDPQKFRFIALFGEAKLVKNKTRKKELWMKDLERWFPQGPESPDVVLIRVRPRVVEYWSQQGDGRIEL